MFEQGCLDLAGTDAVAARLDQIGRAATRETEHTVVVERANVARSKPAVAEGLGGCRWVAEVGVKQRGAPQFDVADHIRVADWQRLASVVGDAQFDTRQCGSDGARNARAIVSCAGDHQRLAHAVTLDDLLARRGGIGLVDAGG